MSPIRGACKAAGLWTLWLAFPLALPPACGQFPPSPQELSGSVNLDEADSAVRAHLERIKAYVADQQWDEAVETLRQVMENHGSKLVPLSRTRYINLTDYCHLQIASLPSEALDLYRERVDPLAQKWYEEGLAQRNADRLADVVDKAFCSSWGDDALLALGEIELERGHYALARHHWQRIVETPPARVAASRYEAARQIADLPPEDARLLDKHYVAESSTPPRWYDLHGNDVLDDESAAGLVRFWKGRHYPFTRLSYPATELPLADVRARLILVSIMEGSLDRAREELRAFTLLHADAEGRLAGRDVKYAEALDQLIDSASNWPQPRPSHDWPTFAGSPERTKVSPNNLELQEAAWEPIRLGEPLSADAANARAYSLRRVGEDAQRLLSYHPLVSGNLILFNNQNQIFAFDLKTGKPAWPSNDPQRPAGEIYSGDAGPTGRAMNRGLGAPRFTMTVADNKLFARMGSPVTSRSLEALEGRSGYLVCLDLAAEGKIVWRLPDKSLPADQRWAFDEKWSFEGSPLVSGPDVYVAMRKSDVRPQAHVACFDVESRRLRWRTMICAAETPGGGQQEEITHNLLTLDHGTIFCNTNLGTVAAVSARDGRLQWAALYPRARRGGTEGQDRRAAHFYRDLNPCIYYRGMLLAAPSDCHSIFALDSSSGELLWESHLPEDAIHLLGVGNGNLLASGDWLWWIDARHGKVLKRWPDTTPLGYGRGALMGDQVVWPTRDALYVFDQRVWSRSQTVPDPIPLGGQRSASGGNLVPAEGMLLIATGDKLFGFHQIGKEPQAHTAPQAAGVAQQPDSAAAQSTKP
jgi:outer membrane protein assembly factor BamB